ncbi:MAG: alginate export family protein [Pseudomonadales bacterium]
MKTVPLLLILFLALASLAPDARAVQTDALKQAVTDSTVKLNLRYRYEYVDQDGVDDEAGASTLRARLSWSSASVGKWQAGAEADYVALLGAERYNSTVNGETQYPVVADPEGFDLNQAFLKYSDDNLTATFGRQRNLQTDQRFVGGVGWRQNEQTYDAARAEFKLNDALSIDYSYVWNVNRIFGPDGGVQPSDWRSDSHFLLAEFALADDHKLEGFAYLLDFENDNGIPNSTATYGVSYRGKLGPLKLTGTYATQSDYADSPLDYDADYFGISAATTFDPVTISVGYELLGSDDGVAAFRTPLATLHKWQGWADKFLGTPADGIEDIYVGIAGAIGPVKLAATYHDYGADEGSADYGDELNVVANFVIADGISGQLKLADYNADEFATDTTKIWFSLIVSL